MTYFIVFPTLKGLQSELLIFYFSDLHEIRDHDDDVYEPWGQKQHIILTLKYNLYRQKSTLQIFDVHNLFYWIILY